MWSQDVWSVCCVPGLAPDVTQIAMLLHAHDNHRKSVLVSHFTDEEIETQG